MEPAEPRHQSDIDIASTGPYLLETLLKASLTKRPNERLNERANAYLVLVVRYLCAACDRTRRIRVWRVRSRIGVRI